MASAVASRTRPMIPPAGGSRIRELLALVDQPHVLSLAGGLPAPDALPEARARAAAGRAFDRVGRLGPVALQYAPTEGVGPLRELIAERHGVAVDHVLVTTGSQQGIDLLCQALTADGRQAVVEAPTYLGARQSLAAAGADVATVGADDDGMDVDQLAERLDRGPAPAMVYLVPNFANPTGSVLAAARRRRLADLAAGHGFVVVEDDPYGDLWFDAPPPASVAELVGGGGAVVRLGSASKVLGPGLRVGWMVGPPDVVAAVAIRKQAADLHTSALDQLIVADLLADPAHADHLDRLRRRYAVRAASLVESLTDQLGGNVQVAAPRGGMFAWARATDGTDADDLLGRALHAGVAFVPGSAFSPGDPAVAGCLRLSFATLEPADLRVAVARLAGAWSG